MTDSTYLCLPMLVEYRKVLYKCCPQIEATFSMNKRCIQKYTVNPLLTAHIRLTQKYPDLRGNRISGICMYGVMYTCGNLYVRCHVQCTCSISQCMIFCVHSRCIHMTEASARRKKVMIYVQGTCIYYMPHDRIHATDQSPLA